MLKNQPAGCSNNKEDFVDIEDIANASKLIFFTASASVFLLGFAYEFAVSLACGIVGK